MTLFVTNVGEHPVTFSIGSNVETVAASDSRAYALTGTEAVSASVAEGFSSLLYRLEPPSQVLPEALVTDPATDPPAVDSATSQG
jgi:hypothetical protein